MKATLLLVVLSFVLFTVIATGQVDGTIVVDNSIPSSNGEEDVRDNSDMTNATDTQLHDVLFSWHDPHEYSHSPRTTTTTKDARVLEITSLLLVPVIGLLLCWLCQSHPMPSAPADTLMRAAQRYAQDDLTVVTNWSCFFTRNDDPKETTTTTPTANDADERRTEDDTTGGSYYDDASTNNEGGGSLRQHVEEEDDDDEEFTIRAINFSVKLDTDTENENEADDDDESNVDKDDDGRRSSLSSPSPSPSPSPSSSLSLPLQYGCDDNDEYIDHDCDHDNNNNNNNSSSLALDEEAIAAS